MRHRYAVGDTIWYWNQVHDVFTLMPLVFTETFRDTKRRLGYVVANEPFPISILESMVHGSAQEALNAAPFPVPNEFRKRIEAQVKQ